MGRAALIALLLCTAMHGQKAYPNRWVYVSRSLAQDRSIVEIEKIVRTASEHGINGMLFSAGLDRMDLADAAWFKRLEKVQEICERYHVDIIPDIFNWGYGGALLAHDRNLAAGLPVRGALFVARGSEASFTPDSPARVVNGGFEEYAGDRLTGYSQQDPLALVDTQVFHGGKSSLRFEIAGAPAGSVFVAQEIPVMPYRSYRVSCWVKTEGIQPDNPFRIRALAPDNRNLSPFEPQLASTGDWRHLTTGFNSWYADRIRLQIGVEEARVGKVWVDDVQVEELGLVNVLRRSGTPVHVRGERRGIEYTEGADYERIVDPLMNFRFNHASPVIHLAPGGRIKEGERLRVDYYHGTTIYSDQVPADMSEPAVFEIWRRNAALIQKHLAPRRWFLSADELRVAGHCEACKRRKMGLAQMLGDTITQQYQMIRALNPEAEIFIWSDMLDPNHNARAKYYLADGDYTGSWNYVPKDLRIMCWYYQKRAASLEFFSRLGFQTAAGAYYDAADLRNPEGWLDALDKTPGAIGIMYTTWRNKFDLLAAFGDLVSKR